MNAEKRYFTIIELAVVVGITALILGAVIASFSSIGYRILDSNTRKLVSDLHWARELSVHNPTPNVAVPSYYCRFLFDIANELYSIYDPSYTLNPGNPGIRKSGKLGVDIYSVAHPNAAGNEIAISPAAFQFTHPQGNVADTASTAFSPRNEVWITLRHGTLSKRIKIFGNTGFIKVE